MPIWAIVAVVVLIPFAAGVGMFGYAMYVSAAVESERDHMPRF